MSKTICLWSLIACFAPSLLAQTISPADSVTFKDNKTYVIQGDQRELITTNLQFPHDVEISTNGTFTVGKGKDRKFEEGQVLLRDGWLLSPDGSFQPVMDHVIMKEGRVLIVRDGQAENLKQTMVFPNNASVTPDGYYTYPTTGRRARLNDGEWFQLNGTPIPTKDAATMINGQVVMQRDGSRISLQPVLIMGMNDGTRVSWDGTIQPPTGPAYKLREGQTVLIVGQHIER
ncbi:MAG: hypothetical protein PHY43_05775 [Verrucomicrobiales bacterium]|nr:hypothetical protein [Verrucomicrobiales bacterium]